MVKLNQSEANSFNQIAIIFTENGSDNFESSFYSLGINNEQLVIQAKAPFVSKEEIIPLGLIVNNENNSTFKIEIDHLENLENTKIYLKDNLLNSITNLNLSEYYFTTSENGTINNRFELILNRSTLNVNNQSFNNNESLIIFNENNDFLKVKTKNNSLIKNIKIYTILGKTILNKKANTNELILR